MRRPIPEAELSLEFRVGNVRLERTGVHGKVSVLANNAVLAWSNFNIERDEDRVRLCNSVYKHLDRLKNVYPPTYLKADLDNFCLGAWDAHLGTLAPEMVAGTLERQLPSFLVRPYLIEGGGSILFAPPGRGKSYMLMLMAVCLDAGLQTLWPVRAARVLMINLERSPRSVADRLGNINQVLGLDRDRKLRIQNARGKSLNDVVTAAERAIEEQEIDVVFLDSISRAGLGDLNDNQAVNKIVDLLNGLSSTWLALAHTPRSDESHLYGSVHFEAGADVVIQLLSQQEDQGPLGVGLQVTKQNDVGKQPMWQVALEFDQAGLTLVRRARPGEFPDIDANRKLSMRDSVREYLLDIGPSCAADIADGTGFNRSSVAMLLTSDQATFTRGGRLGHKVLYAVRG